jgi:large subunit ribosomal protein L13
MKNTKNDAKWWVVDAENQVLGRLSTQIANVLRGKNKPEFTPNTDCGDFVVVTNVDKIKLTGNKKIDKVYYKHSGYIGNLKSINAEDLLEKKPEEVLRHSVSGMLPKNKLRAVFMKKLKLFTGTEHDHEAQKPEVLEVK